MDITIEKKNREITAKLAGRLDTPASLEAAKTLDPLKEEADKKIILDCTELSYISSSGLRIFLSLRKAAAEKGGNVIIRGINNDIRSVFMMTGFLNLFQIED